MVHVLFSVKDCKITILQSSAENNTKYLTAFPYGYRWYIESPPTE